LPANQNYFKFLVVKGANNNADFLSMELDEKMKFIDPYSFEESELRLLQSNPGMNQMLTVGIYG
jgi:hypothetical protein